MVPSRSAHGQLLTLTRNGVPVSRSSRWVKGIDSAVFDAPSGAYAATYQSTAAPPPATDARATPPVARASKRGTIKLAVRCPWTKRRCRITVKLRAGRKTIACKTVTVKGRRTVKATLRLPRATRRKLARRGSLSLTAVITVRARGAKRTIKVPLLVRAPSA